MLEKFMHLILLKISRQLGLAIALCLTVTTTFLIAGCQNNFLANPNKPEITQLTLWHGVNPPPNRDVLQVLVDKFNQTHPQIQVESLYVGQADQQTPKILAAIVGNAPPDLLWGAPMLTGQLVDLGGIVPLDELLQQSPQTQYLDPALRESMTYQGKIWSVPFGTNNVGLFYRPSLFATAGITALPKTWAELRATAQKLTKPGQKGILLPLGKGEWTVFTWLPFMWSGGGDLTTGNQATAKDLRVDNPGAIAALEFWQDLLKDGSAVLSAPERGFELDGFLAGKVAMQITGPWTLGQLQGTKVDFGVMAIPAGARAATSTGGENLFVMKTNSQRQQAAGVFVEYVLSEEFQTAWALGTGYLPVNRRSREDPRYLEFVAQQPAVKVFLDQAAVGRSRPIFSGYSRVSDSLGRAIESVLLNKATPTKALKEAQQRLDLIFN
ncbi:MAG: ABC transporter substrate-binding protein [Coleofasciculaceae cyanobacterium SM2_1_6]|nr:ABC transporter substrate-binding protein [Coleofasciculaceae cyanobacterium SM2_1_6]